MIDGLRPESDKSEIETIILGHVYFIVFSRKVC